MKKIIMCLLLISTMLLAGCGIYGKGETTGYIYAVDDGLLWGKVWYKSSLDSSESDCYLIRDYALKEQLRELADDNVRIKLKYNRHFATLSACPEGTGTDDEIIGFEVLGGK